MRFIQKLQLIDELVKGGPCSNLAVKLSFDDSASGALVRYFLSSIAGDSWLPIVKELLCYRPHTIQETPDAVFGFLLTCSDAEALSLALLVHAQSPDSWADLIKLADKLGFPAALPVLGRLADAECLPAKDHLAPVLGRLLQHAFRQGFAVSAYSVLRNFLRIQPDPRSQGVTSEEGSLRFGLEPSIGIDPYTLQEFLASVVQAKVPDAWPSIMKVFVETLSEAIEMSIWPEDRAKRGTFDGSVVWRPAIEDNAQNRDFGYREQLVVAIRDLGESMLRAGIPIEVLDSLLLSPRWIIFRRVWLHLIRMFPQSAGERVCQSLRISELADTDTWHERALLLAEQFSNLPRSEQDAILGWMTTEPDLSRGIDYYKDSHGGNEPPPDLLERWKIGRWRQKLAIIKDSIPEDWRKANAHLCEELQVIESQQFHYRSSGGEWLVGDRSPLSVEEIAKVTPAKLVGRLADWSEKDPYDGPSESGLLIALKTAAQQNPGEMLTRLHEYDGLQPVRHVALLEGLWDAANTGVSVDWRLLLQATDKEVQHRVLPHDCARNSKREASVGTALIRAIEAALSKDHLPRQYRREIFNCIEVFLTHPDPAPKTDEIGTLPEELSSISLNTPRPIALRCVFDYGRWLRRGGIDEAPEVPQVLERALRNEPALAVRSVFGEQMNCLLAIHRPWVEAQLPELFPAAEPAKRDAIWNCFVTMCGASKAALEIFRAEYERAVGECGSEPTEKPSSDWSPQRGFVRHLSAYYWWGFEPMGEGSLLAKFFETATVSLREYVFRYIAQALDGTKDDLPEAVAKRFMDLADWRIKQLKGAEPGSPETMELRDIVRWADSEKLPPEWMLRSLLEVLTRLSCSGLEHQMLPFDFLAKQVSTSPALAMACLYELTFGPGRMGKKTPPWWGQEDEAKAILRTALASRLPNVVRQAEEVQDHLLRLGRLEYRKLASEGD